MSQVKLFSSTGTRVARRSGKPKKQKVKKPLKTLAIWLLVILCLEALYFFCVYTNNSFVKKWRTIYINTAMDTMRHQWLATYFIPKDVIDEVRYEYGLVRAATVGKESNANWGKKDDTPAGTDTPAADDNVTHINPNITHESEQTEDNTPTAEELEKQAQENFYSVFWELDRTSMEAYLAEHPDTLANGWDQIYINEAGFDDEGTSIQSIFGEQVLAIDAKDGVLLLRISGKGYRGVLAVGKDPSRLSIEMATTLGTAGQLSGTIAEAHNGVLAMNANGFRSARRLYDVQRQGLRRPLLRLRLQAHRAARGQPVLYQGRAVSRQRGLHRRGGVHPCAHRRRQEDHGRLLDRRAAACLHRPERELRNSHAGHRGPLSA